MVRDLIAKAPAGDPSHIKLRLDAKWLPDQKSFLVWRTQAGATDETIYIIAHRDGWFDAAGDNASGVATMQSQRSRKVVLRQDSTPIAFGRRGRMRTGRRNGMRPAL